MENRISVRIVRNDPCVAWGFRISGGRDFGAPVTIQRVNPSSVADRHGLRPGDLLVSIEGQPTSEMKHSEVQLQIKNAEKALNIELERGKEPPTTRPANPDPSPALQQLNIKGTGIEQPASGNRISQPFQANTIETTIPVPYQAPRSTDNVGVLQQVKASSPQSAIKVHHVQVQQQSSNDKGSVPPPPPPPPSSVPAPIKPTTRAPAQPTPWQPPPPPSSVQPPVQPTTRAPAQPTPWQPPPPPFPVADRRASLSDDNYSVTPAADRKSPPGTFQPIGTPAPPPPTVAPKPAPDRKFSADANIVLGGRPSPWKLQDERKGSLDVSVTLSESGLQPVGARKSSWDPTSGKPYTAQPWRPPTAGAATGVRPGSASPTNQGPRKGSLDKPVQSTPMGYTAQPWKQPDSTDDNDRRPSWDKSATLPPAGYSAQPWKPPAADVDRRPSWDKSATLPPAGYSAQPWKPPATDVDRRPSWDKSATLPPPNSADAKKPYSDRSASPLSSQGWKGSSESDRKGTPLGTGQSNSVKKHDVGVCFHCKEVIRGPYLMALDRVYCADHFRCCKCDVKLVNQPFIAHQNEVFCQEDYGKFVAEKCAACGAAILSECLRAMDKAFHPKCFKCTMCQQPIAPGNFRLGSDNKPYCEDDWNTNFQVMCCRCNFPIEPDERFIEALNKSFHAECFECVTCGVKLDGKPFYNRNDKPYCREHVPAH